MDRRFIYGAPKKNLVPTIDLDSRRFKNFLQRTLKIFCIAKKSLKKNNKNYCCFSCGLFN